MKSYMFVYLNVCVFIPEKFLEELTRKLIVLTCGNEMEVWNRNEDQYLIFICFLVECICYYNDKNNRLNI